MTFTTTNFGATAMFRLAGVFGAGESFNNLDAAVGRICTSLIDRTGAVMLDMKRVTLLDCIGIGELIHIRQRVAASGRVFGLINVEPRQRNLLEMARLSLVLGVPDAGERLPIERCRAYHAPRQFGASHRFGLALV